MKFLYKPQDYVPFMSTVQTSNDNWIRRLRNPPVIADKSQCDLAIYGTQVASPELDAESGMPRNIADNMDYLFALQLDYEPDKETGVGVSIDEFRDTYTDIRYTLYTSYSYGSEEKRGDRYRVVIPLAEPLYVRNMNRFVKDALKQHFRNCDTSCFHKGHWQKLPCKRSSDAPYLFFQHGGEPLDLFSVKWQEQECKRYDDFLEQCRIREEAKRAARKEELTNEDRRIAGAMSKAQSIIDEAVNGSRNNTLFSILCWLQRIDVDQYTASELDVWDDLRDDFEGMLDRIWNPR